MSDDATNIADANARGIRRGLLIFSLASLSALGLLPILMRLRWLPVARRSRSPARRMARSVVEMGLADPVTDEALAAVWAATRERALEGDVEAATVVIEVARRQRSDGERRSR